MEITAKKKFILGLLAAFLIPAFASAVKIENPLGKDSTIWTLVGGAINWAFYISLLAGTIAIVVAAFIFLTSAGDPEKVKKGRHIITWALIAIVVIFLAKSIINLLMFALGSEARIP